MGNPPIRELIDVSGLVRTRLDLAAVSRDD
jgi:hypothetical protein